MGPSSLASKRAAKPNLQQIEHRIGSNLTEVIMSVNQPTAVVTEDFIVEMSALGLASIANVNVANEDGEAHATTFGHSDLPNTVEISRFEAAD